MTYRALALTAFLASTACEGLDLDSSAPTRERPETQQTVSLTLVVTNTQAEVFHMRLEGPQDLWGWDFAPGTRTVVSIECRDGDLLRPYFARGSAGMAPGLTSFCRPGDHIGVTF